MSNFKKDLAEVLAFKAGFNAFVSQSAARANEFDKRLKSIESTISDIASKVNAVKPKPEKTIIAGPKNYDDEIKSLSLQIESARRTFGEEVGLLTKRLTSIPKQVDYSGDINDIRKLISELPKPTDYSVELSGLELKIDNLPEQKSYDDEILVLKNELSKLPKPKCYNDEIELLANSVKSLGDLRVDISALAKQVANISNELSQLDSVSADEHGKAIDSLLSEVEQVKKQLSDIPNQIDYSVEIQRVEDAIPTVKYYDDDIESLSLQIESARRTFGEEVGLLTKTIRSLQDGE